MMAARAGEALHLARALARFALFMCGISVTLIFGCFFGIALWVIYLLVSVPG